MFFSHSIFLNFIASSEKIESGKINAALPTSFQNFKALFYEEKIIIILSICQCISFFYQILFLLYKRSQLHGGFAIKQSTFPIFSHQYRNVFFPLLELKITLKITNILSIIYLIFLNHMLIYINPNIVIISCTLHLHC